MESVLTKVMTVADLVALRDAGAPVLAILKEVAKVLDEPEAVAKLASVSALTPEEAAAVRRAGLDPAVMVKRELEYQAAHRPGGGA